MGRVLRGSCLGALAACLLLAGCESSSSTHRLPAYETPIARTDFQTVRTTAYTHTESDHLAYTNHNALGGILHAAIAPGSSGSMVAMAGPVDTREADDAAQEISGYRRVSNDLPETPRPTRSMTAVRPAPAPAVRVAPAPAGRVAPAAARPAPATAAADRDDNPPWMKEYLRRKQQQQGTQVRQTFYVTPPAAPMVYGSAAADWSRWPVGTVFRIQSTGQLYKVDDYGWALAGRNTIDLYQSTRSDMNAWGVRHVPIQVLHWGSREESLRLLVRHQGYKHIRRMVLELEGHDHAAAALE